MITDYQAIKQAVLIPENIAHVQGYYRYIDHARKLCTTGFKTREKLLEYTDCIRFDAGTLEIMQARYKEIA